MNNEEINYGPITAGMKEEPFYRDGMISEEWEAEKQYLNGHYKEWMAGTYLPLWKQRTGYKVPEHPIPII